MTSPLFGCCKKVLDCSVLAVWSNNVVSTPALSFCKLLFTCDSKSMRKSVSSFRPSAGSASFLSPLEFEENKSKVFEVVLARIDLMVEV